MTATDRKSFDQMTDEQLVDEYEGLVESVVYKLWNKCIGAMAIEDMRSCAYEGLLQARRNFDPDEGTKFSSYAYKRIWGAVVDGLRRARWGPRSQSVETIDDMKASGIRKSNGKAASEAVEPDDEEDDARDEEAGYSQVQLMMLGPVEFERLELTEEESQDETATRNQRRELVSEAMSELGEIERTIVRLHDIEGKSFTAIADEIGCSKSWTCRLRDRAIDEIRDHVGVTDEEDDAESGDQSVASLDAAA
jgi:RNA polymerase sigma factor for flagellar operon FliA